MLELFIEDGIFQEIHDSVWLGVAVIRGDRRGGALQGDVGRIEREMKGCMAGL